MKIVIINGPNLNLLGSREPCVYGNQSFDIYYEALKSEFPGVEFDYFQSNIEGELINHIQKAIIMNYLSVKIIQNIFYRKNQMIVWIFSTNTMKSMNF